MKSCSATLESYALRQGFFFVLFWPFLHFASFFFFGGVVFAFVVVGCVDAVVVGCVVVGCVVVPPTVIVFAPFSCTLLPAGSPPAWKKTLTLSPGWQAQGGGASETLHENELALVIEHDPTLEESTLETVNVGPAVKTTDVITSEPEFSTPSRYSLAASGSSFTFAFASLTAAVAWSATNSPRRKSGGSTSQRFIAPF